MDDLLLLQQQLSQIQLLQSQQRNSLSLSSPPQNQLSRPVDSLFGASFPFSPAKNNAPNTQNEFVTLGTSFSGSTALKPSGQISSSPWSTFANSQNQPTGDIVNLGSSLSASLYPSSLNPARHSFGAIGDLMPPKINEISTSPRVSTIQPQISVQQQYLINQQQHLQRQQQRNSFDSALQFNPVELARSALHERPVGDSMLNSLNDIVHSNSTFNDADLPFPLDLDEREIQTRDKQNTDLQFPFTEDFETSVPFNDTVRPKLLNGRNENIRNPLLDFESAPNFGSLGSLNTAAERNRLLSSLSNAQLQQLISQQQLLSQLHQQQQQQLFVRELAQQQQQIQALSESLKYGYQRSSQPPLPNSWSNTLGLSPPSGFPALGSPFASEDGFSRNLGLPSNRNSAPQMPNVHSLLASTPSQNPTLALQYLQALSRINAFRDAQQQIASQSYNQQSNPGSGITMKMHEQTAGVVEKIDEDGCPILKVPRLPFRGIEGFMNIPHRQWKKGGNENIDSRHFTIMSYNVFAPLYSTDSQYTQIDSKVLAWESRRERILDEISFYTPDFVCLQELPPLDFKEYFLPELQRLGYDGHFQLKKREHAADGCATFYMESRFQLLAVQAFAYHDQVQGSDFTADLKDRLNPFSNIALVCVLQNRQSSKSLRVRVVNTHFHWDPNFGDTKLLQAAILMEWLEKSHKDVPTVIAADLNSRVGDPVLDYLVRGRVAPGYLFSGKDFGRFSGGPWPVLPPPPTISATTSVVIGGLSLSAAPSVSVITPDGSIQAPTVPRPNSIGSPSYSSVTVGSYPRKGVPIHPSSITQNSTNLDFSPRSFPDGTSPSPLPVFQPVSTQMQQPPFLLRHGTKLASAYDRRDLPFTNKTPEFCGSIDHILYTSGTLSIRDVLADLTLTPFDKPLETEITGVASQASTPSVEKNEFLDTSLVAEDTKFGQNQAPSPATTEDQIYRPVFRNQTPEYSPIEISKTINSTLIPIPSQDNAEKIGSENPPISGSPVPGPPTTSANPMPYVNPNPTFLSKIQALPSKQFPSDHIPLIAVLKWKTVPILSPSSGGGRHSHGGSGSWKRGGGLSGHGSYIEENQMGSSPASYQNTYSVGGAPQNFQRVSAPLTNIHSALTNSLAKLPSK